MLFCEVSEPCLNITRQTKNKPCLLVKINLEACLAEWEHMKWYQEHLGGLGDDK